MRNRTTEVTAWYGVVSHELGALLHIAPKEILGIESVCYFTLQVILSNVWES